MANESNSKNAAGDKKEAFKFKPGQKYETRGKWIATILHCLVDGASVSYPTAYVLHEMTEDQRKKSIVDLEARFRNQFGNNMLEPSIRNQLAQEIQAEKSKHTFPIPVHHNAHGHASNPMVMGMLAPTFGQTIDHPADLMRLIE